MRGTWADQEYKTPLWSEPRWWKVVTITSASMAKLV
jgi:hypothetical protein